MSIIVKQSLQSVNVNLAQYVESIVDFYLEARKRSAVDLLDGANQRAHYSIRTLVRALDYARSNVAVYGFERALYEGWIPISLAVLIVNVRLHDELWHLAHQRVS